MKKASAISVLVIILCHLSATVLATGSRYISFSHISADEGLSQVSVNDIYIDEFGFVWIGTNYGLNRYDGRDIEKFRMEKGNPQSLFCNNVYRLAGNGDGKVWAACTEGIAELDLEKMCFRTLMKREIKSMFYGDALYAGYGCHVLRKEDGNDIFEEYISLPDNVTEISAITATADGLMWLGTAGDGAYVLDKGTGSLTHPVTSGSITNIYEDKAGNIWLGSWDEGLRCITTEGIQTIYRHDSSNPDSIASDFVRCCCEDESGRIWVGTFTGLDCIERTTGRISHYTADRERDDGLSHSSIWCLRKDRQGNIWAGTYFGGVNWFNPEFSIFTRYLESSQPGKGLSSSIVGKMTEDRNGNLWIATEGGGVNYLDRKTGRFTWYRKDGNQDALSGDNIKSLYYDSDKGILWIGTHIEGLNRLDIKSGKFSHYKLSSSEKPELPSDIIRDILPYGDSLVLATENGVSIFDRRSGNCRKLFAGMPEETQIKKVTDLLMDANGNLWLSTMGEGVFKYRLESGEIHRYVHDSGIPGSISSNSVYNIFQDSMGNLWFSTSGSGMDRLSPGSEVFRNYDRERNMLGSDCVYQVCESPFSGNLLIITDSGFSIFNYATEQARSYNIGNGFPFTAANENALQITRDGTIFLGSTQGMVSFRESDLDLPQKPYSIYFSRLYANSNAVNPKDGTGILDKSLLYQDEIILKPDISMFNIEVTASNYLAANKHSLEYRLEGFSQAWNPLRNDNTITYSNLSPGRYRLVVRAENHDSDIQSSSLSITVLPPWYASPAAYITYIFLAVIILWISVMFYKGRVRLRTSLEYEQKRNQDIKALNQSKLRFFTNIAHEIRTPLTIIIAEVESIMLNRQDFTPSLYKKVLSVYKNSIQLRGLISELLEFRKQEQGHMKIMAAPHNIVYFINELYLLFNEYAQSRGLNLAYIKDMERIEVWYDQKQMQKVLSNILSNAMKYTETEGNITIHVYSKGSDAIIEISDTGCGIAAYEQEKIFDSFYRIDRPAQETAKEGSGIGLALAKGIVELHSGKISVTSKPGCGSTFTISLPLGYSHFRPEQIEKAAPAEIPRDGHQPGIQETGGSRQADTSLPKMIVAEDNEGIRELLVEIFSSYYNVIAVNDGEKAYNIICKEIPAIVVSDVIMPNMSGIDLCRKIKNDINTCHIPVVLLTARVAVEQNLEGLLTGADDYITKPFNTSLLISRCNNLVNSRITLQEKFCRQPQAPSRILATNPLDKKLIDKANRIIEENIGNADFNVAMFAKELAMSRAALFTKIKAITGMTPNDFIMSIRLKKGAYLLRNSPELSITEISEMTGFNSPKYFSKCFNDMYHTRPSAYREAHD
ncbi:MAG: ATP-binding protein [Bacteroidales bacterium]|nr:ATP-binding protein [Bacteroidales bacterium]